MNVSTIRRAAPDDHALWGAIGTTAFLIRFPGGLQSLHLGLSRSAKKSGYMTVEASAVKNSYFLLKILTR
jgi:hypothetical protein